MRSSGPWLGRLVDSHENRKDVRAFLRTCQPKVAYAAAKELESFPRPALIAWSRGDRLFPDLDAERLARTIPDCELHWIENTRTFSMINQSDALDQPGALVALVRPFLERLSNLSLTQRSPSRAVTSGLRRQNASPYV